MKSSTLKTKKGKITRKPLSTAKLKKKLDQIFSQFIRQKYANQEGQVKCYTCSKVAHWKEMQCGHFVSRVHLATRFEESNVRVQCVGCNIFGQGKTAVFASLLEAERPGVVTSLYQQAQNITKDYPYAEKIEHYKKLIN